MRLERVLARQRLEVAKTHANPMADFDRLMHGARELEGLARAALERGEGLSEDGEDAGRMLVAYARAVETQGEKVERYKTGHAVMRNSRRFLPDAAQEAADGVRTAGQAGLARRIERSERRLRAWMEAPDAPRRRQAVEALDRVRRAVAGSTGASASAGKVRRYLAHAEVLLEHRDRTAGFLADAVAERSDELEEVLAELRTRRTETQARRTGAMVATAAGGLALAGLAMFAIVSGSGSRRTKRRKQREAGREGRREATDLEQVLTGMLQLYAQIDEQAEPPGLAMRNDSKGAMATVREDGARPSPERAHTTRPQSILRFFRAPPAHPADTSTADAAEATSKVRSDPR